MIIVINLFINLYEFFDLYLIYLSCFLCCTENIISVMRRIVLFAFQKQYFFSFFSKMHCKLLHTLNFVCFLLYIFFSFFFISQCYSLDYIFVRFPMQRCVQYTIFQKQLYIFDIMYISYTAAFHSQLPFFFVYLFFPL